MHVQPHNPIDHLKQMRRLKSQVSIAMPLQVVILAMEGRTAPQIAAATGMSWRPVRTEKGHRKRVITD